MSKKPKFYQYKLIPVDANRRIDNTLTSDQVGEDVRANGWYNIGWLQEVWKITRRPFYNVYPSVTRCLSNSSLNFRISQLTSFFEPTAICLSKGHELPRSLGVKATSVIAAIFPFYHDENGEVNRPILRIAAAVVYPDGGQGAVHVEYHGSETLCEIVETVGEEPELLRLCAGIIMLAKDPDFAERILLNRDRDRIERLDTPEKRDAAVERAIRNGRNGWTIGEHLEVSPHTRRPHFAIRWTGKGSVTPKLVPVKGCVVKRSKLYPIPTGYMDDKTND